MAAAREGVGEAMHALIASLFPICRSITGDGFQETLGRLREQIPLTVREVPTGTAVFDWTVPNEWNIRDAYVDDARGERVIDFRRSNLHVVNYSAPVRARLSFRKLRERLFSLPEHPDWIPYRTSYYNETWGFCLSHNDLLVLAARGEEAEYEVCIDASLEPGHLAYGELLLEGEREDEVLISCHACHPSLANDNLSGIAVATFLARHLAPLRRRYSYRFLFIPGTIGAITWLSVNERRVGAIKHGLVLAGVGDRGNPTYKSSRRGAATIDRAMAHVLRHRGAAHAIEEFSPYGYDERQFCSPGFNLPVGRLSRTPYGRYPEYHTSADDLGFVDPAALADSFDICLAVIEVLEHDRIYLNLNPKCEPQLGKRGLYRAIGGQTDGVVDAPTLLWVLNLSDGDHTLLDIAERSGYHFAAIKAAADALREQGLLRERVG